MVTVRETEEISVVLIIAAVLVVAFVVYFSTLAIYASQIDTLKANLGSITSNYINLNNSYSILSAKYGTLLNSTYQKLLTSKNITQPPQTIFSGKKLTLKSLLYPGYINQPYSVNSLQYFQPSNTYVYYRPYTYPPYAPLQYINASYSRFYFNITSQAPGYVLVNYTSNSPNGLVLVNYQCQQNASQSSAYSSSNTFSNGSINIPVNEGKSCLYIQNPSNFSIGVRFTATLVVYR